MRVFINELALADACATDPAPPTSLEALLEARQRFPVLRQALYCARGMPNTTVGGRHTLADVVRGLPRDKISLFFQWLVNTGPFIENDRQPIDDDLFVFGDDDVTDLGLGEAARRVLVSKSAATLSATSSTAVRFAEDPLKVVHGIPEDPFTVVDVPNYTSVEGLVAQLSDSRPAPRTWTELLALCRQDFDRLNIGIYCERVLSRHPYSRAAGRRIRDLLTVLQQLMAEMDDSGRLSTQGVEVFNGYFVGDKAWFTDESATRKNAEQKFTFPNPDGDGTLVCFWHGKVSVGAFRVHFEWPVQRPSQRLRVAYMGPHL